MLRTIFIALILTSNFIYGQIPSPQGNLTGNIVSGAATQSSTSSDLRKVIAFFKNPTITSSQDITTGLNDLKNNPSLVTPEYQTNVISAISAYMYQTERGIFSGKSQAVADTESNVNAVMAFAPTSNAPLNSNSLFGALYTTVIDSNSALLNQQGSKDFATANLNKIAAMPVDPTAVALLSYHDYLPKTTSVKSALEDVQTGDVARPPLNVPSFIQ